MSDRAWVERTICSLLSGSEIRGWPRVPPAAWLGLVETAAAEGVAPLLHSRLSQAGMLDELPPSARAALELACLAARAHNLLLFNAFERLAPALAGPPIVLLKGIALSQALYPEPALRPVGDIDLLLPRAAIPAALSALGRCGYTAIYREASPGLDDLVEFQSALRGGPGGRVTVELHWGLVAPAADRRAPPVRWFWERTEPWPAPFAGPGQSRLLQLNPTAQVLYLAAHLALQHQPRLIWFVDLSRLVALEGPRIDWHDAAAAARAFGWMPALAAALRGARARFGTPLPGRVTAAPASAQSQRAARISERPANRWTGFWIKAHTLRPGARLRLIAGMLLPSPDYMRWRYGGRRLPVAYIWRWLDALAEAARAVGRRPRSAPVGQPAEGSRCNGPPVQNTP